MGLLLYYCLHQDRLRRRGSAARDSTPFAKITRGWEWPPHFSYKAIQPVDTPPHMLYCVHPNNTQSVDTTPLRQPRSYARCRLQYIQCSTVVNVGSQDRLARRWVYWKGECWTAVVSCHRPGRNEPPPPKNPQKTQNPFGLSLDFGWCEERGINGGATMILYGPWVHVDGRV